jgi:hypothetical protein
VHATITVYADGVPRLAWQLDQAAIDAEAAGLLATAVGRPAGG